MVPILHSSASVVHVAAVGLAVLAGTAVLLLPKGTRAHRYLGRAYVGSLALGLLTAFRIYALFGQFGVVHWGAVASAGVLLLGTGAVWGRAWLPAWRQWHYLGMGASVTGLYAALVVESTYRLFPVKYFWYSTLGPAVAVIGLGGWLLYRHFPAPGPGMATARPGLPVSGPIRSLSELSRP